MIDYGDTEKNPKLKEIFDLLLLYGYFRIRIPSISIFDKILGGLTWCIQCSYFEIGSVYQFDFYDITTFMIDIDYNDDLNLGEKVKLSEKVV